MRLTRSVLAWREAATVMIFARNKTPTPTHSHHASAKYDYRFLMLERSSKSSFMPSAYVFPGGGISKADFSDSWLELYQNLGITDDINKSVPKPQQSPTERAPMLTMTRDWPVCSDVAFRICSIRETFEEAGILLCKHKTDVNGTSGKQATNVDARQLQEWRPIIQKDASKFVEMCQTLSIVPDIWALHEWSCWLTPTNMEKMHSGRRYDTIFYICGLPEHVDAVHDQQEIVSSKWVAVPDVLDGHYNQKLWLAPPQIYEMRRLAKFHDFNKLQDFSTDRQNQGCVRWLPVRMMFTNGVGAALPGDDLYPGDVDLEGTRPPPEISESFEESLAKAQNIHRFDFRSYHDIQLHCNIPQVVGHVDPVPVGEVLK